MCHIISLKVTTFQQPLLITPGVADEKPEGGKKAPLPRNIGLMPLIDVSDVYGSIYKTMVHSFMNKFDEGRQDTRTRLLKPL